MSSKRTRALRTFEFRVSREVDCLVTVQALSLHEATAKIDAGEWESKQELEQVNWQRIGTGKEDLIA